MSGGDDATGPAAAGSRPAATAGSSAAVAFGKSGLRWFRIARWRFDEANDDSSREAADADSATSGRAVSTEAIAARPRDSEVVTESPVGNCGRR